MHVEGAGDATTVAQTIKAAIGQTGDTIAAPPSGGNPSGLDVTAINGVLGGAAEVGNGVVDIDVDRADSFTMFGVPVPQSMGAESTIMFQPAPSGGAAAAFEVAVLPSELDAVTKVLRSGGIMFTALHNHSVGMQPPLFFLHGSAVGDPIATARIIRSALNQTDSAGSPRVQFGAAQ